MNKLKVKPPTRRDAADHARLKEAGAPAHINAREARLLAHEMPEAAGKVITSGLLAEAGILGDDRVTKLTPAERRLLKAHGGSGDRNPVSGLLQYGDGMGGSDNPGGGHNADGPGGNPGGSSSGGYGGYGGPSSPGGGGGYYGGDVNTKPSIADMSLSDLQDQFSQQRGSFIDSLLSMPSGFKAPGYEDLSTRQYSPLDTWSRFAETALYGPPRDIARTVPGKWGAPNNYGPGIVGTAAKSFSGLLGGLMTVGGIMGQSMSPAAQEKSMAESQAQGTKNSTGNDTPQMSFAAAMEPGAASGSEMPGLLYRGLFGEEDPGAPDQGTGPPVGPGGALIDTGRSKTATGLPKPIQNILLDYIWNGRQGWEL